MSARRTSGRARATTKKYNVDAFAGLEDILGSEGEASADERAAQREQDRDEDDDVDFDEEQAQEEEAEAAAEDAEADAEPAEESEDEEQGRDYTGTIASDDEDDMFDIVGEEVNTPKPKRGSHVLTTKGARSAPKLRKLFGIDPSTVAGMAAFDKRAFDAPARTLNHTRGVPEYHHSVGKSTALAYMYGDASEDLEAYLEIKTQFYDQITLPSRHTIRKKGNEFGSLAYNAFYTADKRNQELNEGWSWYNNGGKTIFEQHQEEKTSPYLDTDGQPQEGYPIMMGTAPTSSIHRLPLNRPISLSTLRQSSTKPKVSLDKGWLIKLSGSIQCMEWVPNRDSTRQLLCIVVAPDEGILHMDHQTNAFVAPAGFYSTMQIWEFRAQSGATVGACPDMSWSPRLKAVLSWDWGDLRKLEWCPTARPAAVVDEDDMVNLGLLAGIWRDGFMRVLDIRLKLDDSDDVIRTHYDQAALAVRPPDAVCTSISWISSSSIIVGCANGCIGIWDIPRSLAAPRHDPKSSPRPWFYHRFHDSYVLDARSGRPSRPHMIFSSGIDGMCRVIDVRSPVSDMCQSQRVRVAISPIAWMDQIQSLVATDENQGVLFVAMRRIYTRTTIHKLSSLAKDIAISPVHGCTLYGCADGTVHALNAIRRARPVRAEMFSQIWFRHEWRRPTSSLVLSDDVYKYNSNPNAATKPLAVNTPATSGPAYLADQIATEREFRNTPLCRMVDGFALDKYRNVSMKSTAKDNLIVTTIHEVKSAVTRVCWNPNMRCGTWAAAGMGDGLVRVEDIGID